jgi:hypothetical protein
VRIPGKKDYFRATMGDNFAQFRRDRLALTRGSAELMQRAEARANAKHPSVRRQLGEIREFLELPEAEQLALVERWEQRPPMPKA